ncbi:hypothetical protein [Flavivirga algicola]|uniref:Knr4/Smi1-like domain-containing protein n=1 Tax=Flavivirga algicola TaxID=2729136 RepID=A0ABX1S109_9FLAO|nr:hypothetical protein [Flavivirga algicola]NMH88925.1 hypothetical protein [Flavivirga algicola]
MICSEFRLTHATLHTINLTHNVMSQMLNTVKSYCKSSIPTRLEKFYLSEMENYSDSTIANLPGWDPVVQFELNFSETAFTGLQNNHEDWLASGSKKDNCEYIAFSTLADLEYRDELTDFLAIDIRQENCPVYYGDHETGEFINIHKTLDYFLEYLDDEDVNPMEQFGALYEKAQDAFSKSDHSLIVETLGAFFEKNQINPGIPGPYMKEIPEALNLLACAYDELEQPEKAMEYLDLACNGIFCRNAFLNRVKFNLISSKYDIAMEQCNQGLERFSDDYSKSFLNLYKGIIYGVYEKNNEALECFALMTGNVEKSDFEILTPVAAIYTHFTEIKDFEMVFNRTSKMIQEYE